MSAQTKIAWCDVTDNIIVAEGGGWWCRKISPGCANCYAEKLNQSKFFGGNKQAYSGNPPVLKLRMDIIDGWERQRNPKRHFVASMTDVFGEWVSFQEVVTFMRGMWRAPKQTFQVLTKRPEHMARMIREWLKWDMLAEVPSNIWLGVSVENQEWADKRIPVLLSIPAKVRFLSVEPMLGPLDLSGFFGWYAEKEAKALESSVLKRQLLQLGDTPGINWVIVGGESGPKARPCEVDWIRSIIRQCSAANVPCFTKQLGSHILDYQCVSANPVPDRQRWPDGVIGDEGERRIYIKHSKGGDPSEWPEDLRVREFPV